MLNRYKCFIHKYLDYIIQTHPLPFSPFFSTYTPDFLWEFLYWKMGKKSAPWLNLEVSLLSCLQGTQGLENMLKVSTCSPTSLSNGCFPFKTFIYKKILFCFPKARLHGGNILPSNRHLQAKESCLGRSPRIAHTYLYVEILNLHPPKIKARQMMKSIPMQTATSIAVSMFLLHFVSAMKAA